MNETMKATVDVLKELGVSYHVLCTSWKLEYIPKPKTKIGTSYVWTEPEIEAARLYFANRRKPGRPKKGAA